MVYGGEDRLGRTGRTDARAQADERLVKVKPRLRRAESLLRSVRMAARP